jgi:7-carboxy-7-deazaguanine synthase
MATVAQAPSAVKTFPIIEIFGPTIQGEGAEAGLACHFVRLGGCDFRCSWCDTMYAVDPAEVRRNAAPLSAKEITAKLGELGGSPQWVVLSGGNPSLHELGPLVSDLQERGLQVAVETQGSVWRDWLWDVDRLTISPKPPSSGMATAAHSVQFEAFMKKAMARSEDAAVLKIVCFDEIDLTWANNVAQVWSSLPLYLSAGTPVPAPSDVRAAVAARYRWLCERVAKQPALARARVLPQLHVIAWGDERGV